MTALAFTSFEGWTGLSAGALNRESNRAGRFPAGIFHRNLVNIRRPRLISLIWPVSFRSEMRRFSEQRLISVGGRRTRDPRDALMPFPQPEPAGYLSPGPAANQKPSGRDRRHSGSEGFAAGRSESGHRPLCGSRVGRQLSV